MAARSNFTVELYLAVTDLITTKEGLQVLKVKLPDGSVLNMSIYSRRNTKKYFAHILAVLHIIKQKGLGVQCRKLGKAVVKLTKMFKILLKAAGSKDTVSLDDGVEATRWRLRRCRRCPKKPRSSLRRQLPRRQATEEPPVW
jgi:hypothetical protein